MVKVSYELIKLKEIKFTFFLNLITKIFVQQQGVNGLIQKKIKVRYIWSQEYLLQGCSEYKIKNVFLAAFL